MILNINGEDILHQDDKDDRRITIQESYVPLESHKPSEGEKPDSKNDDSKESE